MLFTSIFLYMLILSAQYKQINVYNVYFISSHIVLLSKYKLNLILMAVLFNNVIALYLAVTIVKQDAREAMRVVFFCTCKTYLYMYAQNKICHEYIQILF